MVLAPGGFAGFRLRGWQVCKCISIKHLCQLLLEMTKYAWQKCVGGTSVFMLEYNKLSWWPADRGGMLHSESLFSPLYSLVFLFLWVYGAEGATGMRVTRVPCVTATRVLLNSMRASVSALIWRRMSRQLPKCPSPKRCHGKGGQTNEYLQLSVVVPASKIFCHLLTPGASCLVSSFWKHYYFLVFFPFSIFAPARLKSDQ